MDKARPKRLKDAVEQLSGRDTTSGDRSKHYVACAKCIDEGIPYVKGSRTNNYVHRRDQLSMHMNVVHNIEKPGNTFKFECTFEKRKQSMLSFANPGAAKKCCKEEPDNLPDDGHEEDEHLPDGHGEEQEHLPDDQTAEMGDDESLQESDNEMLPEVDSHGTVGVASLLDSSSTSHLPLNMKSFFEKVLLLLIKILAILEFVKEHLTQKKSTVVNKERDVKLDGLYGRHWSLSASGDKFVHDDTACKQMVTACKSLDHILEEVPFFQYNEETSKLICHFCPKVDITYEESISQRFQGPKFVHCKQTVIKHCLSNKHQANITTYYQEQCSEKTIKKYNEEAGMNVVEQVYIGMKEGFSLRLIQENICNLHLKGIEVGNINHSTGTIRKIKSSLFLSLKESLKTVMASPLACTKRVRPVCETIDKMTHNHSTGQMQMAIVPLLNNYELLTPVYIETYTVKYTEGRYAHLIESMRKAGNEYYDSTQVEGAAADGAYIKSSVHKALNKELGVPEEASWFPFQWDVPHRINLCDEKAKKENLSWSKTLNDCQSITKLFRWGKEHQGLIELVDELNTQPDSDTSDIDDELEEGNKKCKFYSPVLMSDLKFAAYGHKFLNTYIKNLPIYIRRLNISQLDVNHNDEQKQVFLSWLKKISVFMVTMSAGLLDYYHLLAKSQHGASTVNKLPWEYYDCVNSLIDSLKEMSTDVTCWKILNKYLHDLKEGVIDGVPIRCELPVITRRSSAQVDPCIEVENAITELLKVASLMCYELEGIVEPDIIKHMRNAFQNWEETGLMSLIDLSKEAPDRNYGNTTDLVNQYRELKTRIEKHTWSNGTTEAQRWLVICRNPGFYSGLEDIIHFALCCFVKSPLEAVVETVGSVINRHGHDSRGRLKADGLSQEVAVAYNGPRKFTREAKAICKSALSSHFTGKSVHFYTKKGHFKVASSTIATILKKRSRIDF